MLLRNTQLSIPLYVNHFFLSRSFQDLFIFVLKFHMRCLVYCTEHLVGPFNMETSALYFLYQFFDDFFSYFHCSLWISWSDLLIYLSFLSFSSFLYFYSLQKTWKDLASNPAIDIYIFKNSIIFLKSKHSLYCSLFLLSCAF